MVAGLGLAMVTEKWREPIPVVVVGCGRAEKDCISVASLHQPIKKISVSL